MVRIRATRAVRALTLEEKTRVANLFMLLIEVNLEKGITNKRRAPQAAKAKPMNCAMRTIKKDCPINPYFAFSCETTQSMKATKGKKFYNQSSSRRRSLIRTARRDLCLQPFGSSLSGKTYFIWGNLYHDRHHNFNTHARHLRNH